MTDDNCIEGRTPMNISQKWMKIATNVMDLGERCYNWSL
jgi:hypothetical protein